MVWQEEQGLAGVNCNSASLASPFQHFLRWVRFVVTKNRIDPQGQTMSVLMGNSGKAPKEWRQYSVFLPVVTYLLDFSDGSYSNAQTFGVGKILR